MVVPAAAGAGVTRVRSVMVPGVLIFTLFTTLGLAQRRFGDDYDFGNIAYDGRVTFVRLRYLSGFGGGSFRRDPPWSHDYPTSDRHLMKIVNELTVIRPNMEESNVLALDDVELFKYPFSYMSEPGFWNLTDEEAVGLRNYLLKGGFIVFDDFRNQDLFNFEEQVRKALPDAQFIPLDSTHPIFHSFFELNSIQSFHQMYDVGTPVFYGVFEDNDPTKRLLIIANYNNDLGEYWEFSGTGLVPIDLTNESYKFGVNYVVYALTH